MKSTKKYNFLGFGNHAQDSIPAEPLPLSGLGTLGGDASAHGVSLAGWVQPVGELLLNFDAVIERQALGVFTPLVDVRSVINKEVPHNAVSIANAGLLVKCFFELIHSFDDNVAKSIHVVLADVVTFKPIMPSYSILLELFLQVI